MVSTFYNPPHFRIDDPAELARTIDHLVFATLVTGTGAGLAVSHAPFRFNGEVGPSGVLEGHLARANPQVEGLDGTEALVIFQGPAYYVSPSWYASKIETHKVVPTWNYVVVHARGTVCVFDEPERIRARVAAQTAQMEASRAAPWTLDDAPAEFVDALTRSIVGVDVVLQSVEGKFKLGQNRSAEDRSSLRQALASERPEIAEALARLISD